MKDFFDLQLTAELWEKFNKELSHELDGLVFQPINDVSTMLISLSIRVVILNEYFVFPFSRINQVNVMKFSSGNRHPIIQ